MINHTSTRNGISHASSLKNAIAFHEILQIALNVVLFTVNVALEGEFVVHSFLVHIDLLTTDLKVLGNGRNFNDFCHFRPIVISRSLTRTIFGDHHTRFNNSVVRICPLILIVTDQESAVGVHVCAGKRRASFLGFAEKLRCLFKNLIKSRIRLAFIVDIHWRKGGQTIVLCFFLSILPLPVIENHLHFDFVHAN